MTIPIISVGNSKGIRLSKTLLERYQLDQEVEIELKDDCIVLKPTAAVRVGWGSAFAEMAANDEDGLAIPDVFVDEADLLDEVYGDEILAI